MRLPPLMRFLGVPEPATPAQVLGLRQQRPEALQIEEALRRRLAEIDDHPAAASAEAEALRVRLRSAAAALHASAGSAREQPADAVEAHQPARRAAPPPASPRTPGPVRPAPARFRLTNFDQQVLAVLIANRGWNARARSQLVALAGAYSVTVGGLLKVVTGLSEYAKAGGPRLGVQEITAGSARMDAPPRDTAAAPSPAAAVVETLSRRLDPDQPWLRTKLSLLFGLITLLGGVLILQLVLSGRPPGGQGDPQGLAGETPAPQPGPPIGGGRRAEVPGDAPPAAVRPVRFERPPGFTGNARPHAAIEAADRAAESLEALEALADGLTSGSIEPAEAERRWGELVDRLATGWVIAERTTAARQQRAVADVLYAAAGRPALSDALLGRISPPAAPGDALDVWRGAWRAGTLGGVAGSTTLPPVVTERARHLLRAASGAETVAEATSFTAAADGWLRGAIAPLAERADRGDESAYDRWELWLAAQRRLDEAPGGSSRFEGAIIEALTAVLAGGADLARPGVAGDVAARLLAAADLRSSELTRDGILALFEDERISGRDLWVLTSLLAREPDAPWFSARLLMAPEADIEMRRRFASLIGRSWPESAPPVAAGAAVLVDGELLERWRKRLAQLEARPADAIDVLPLLAATARLNAAAALLAERRGPEARRALEELASMSMGESAAPGGAGATQRPDRPGRGGLAARGGPPRPGQAIGADGAWSAAYEQLGRNLEQRLEWLGTLRRSAGTDLGPIDAATLVTEAYRGTPAEVRLLARALIVEQFSAGPVIATELVDRFPLAPGDRDLAMFIESLTGQMLPERQEQRWTIAARRALVEHALALRQRGPLPVDDHARAIAQAYGQRLGVLRGPSAPAPGEADPAAMAAAVLEAWQQRCALAMVTGGPLTDLAALHRRQETRRRLAQGPVQRFVANQLGILDAMAYLAASEQPAQAGRIELLLEQSRRSRARLVDVQSQALEVERAIARLWSLRMAAAGAEQGSTG